MNQHEKDVENFYSKGARRVVKEGENFKHFSEGFISFGYWEPGDTYVDAAKRLLRFFIDNSGIKKAGRILNVACGYGAESFAYFKKFRPGELIGIDITQAHVDYANWKAKELGVAKKVKFVHGDAVALDFPDASFSHILGIEGPAHFNTREKFFKSAGRVLKKKGELLLTDIILGEKFRKWNPVHQIVLRAGAKGWVVPIINGIKEKEYVKQLEGAGFEIVFLKRIGDKVFPGYAGHFTEEKRKENRKRMSFFAELGLTKIGRMLGYLYRKGFIEYIYVKARKK
ncbi:MAG: methyltransferase domain-containing protein [Candidatus Nanoarchaeia archaeon]|nr:methyltransferase domain-containing protein [Candidatus Nanoarchaeia archaeon]